MTLFFLHCVSVKYIMGKAKPCTRIRKHVGQATEFSPSYFLLWWKWLQLWSSYTARWPAFCPSLSQMRSPLQDQQSPASQVWAPRTVGRSALPSQWQSTNWGGTGEKEDEVGKQWTFTSGLRMSSTWPMTTLFTELLPHPGQKVSSST